ncbi:unnamed protein product [Oppiella nova]|uniref:BolA family transcriptional regulator n=1 Tax=Oppiella nova TaxID=334625 RepID=A0A7R9QNX8_9ACAR|nr:unnamed protein product [Oppiella nova]CAG2170211.1 unnamed protein product [Oppiella nova]
MYMNVMNESHKHNVPKGSETHFRVVIVSPQFESLTSLKRHRLVNEALRQELDANIHALAIQALTPDQWSHEQSVNESPTCRGGMGL